LAHNSIKLTSSACDIQETKRFREQFYYRKDRQPEKYVGSWSQLFGCGQSWLATTLDLRADGSCDVRQEWGGEKSGEGSRSGKGTWKLSGKNIEVSYLVDDGEDKGSGRKVSAKVKDFSEDAYFRERWNKVSRINK